MSKCVVCGGPADPKRWYEGMEFDRSPSNPDDVTDVRTLFHIDFCTAHGSQEWFVVADDDGSQTLQHPELTKHLWP